MEIKRLIVAGGRDFNDARLLSNTLFALAEEVGADVGIELISGMARGADRLAYEFAKMHNVVCHEFPANWDKYGKSAGYRRNEEMAKFADMALVFWDGKSRGTGHMIDSMQRMNKPVQVIRY